ncbi:MAG: hypothetical protein QOJ51_591 [Acidobacteriaceae bacterium]|jgi:hypothetical protein|nr:hypothetical protein [Acidobacteriaceae bacterium]MEA3006064.1 hypothetical protein [Acidobacteriaceae bacterium]
MSRAIRNGGWTLLLLSTIYGSTVEAQRGLRGGGGPPPAPAQAPSAAAPTTPAPTAQPAVAPQPAPAPSTEVAPSMLQQPAKDAQIVFSDGNLSIRADNSSLAAILHQVASNSGMKIEGLGGDERVFGSFGPGVPRDVLADLLVGTAYNQVLLGDLSNGAPRELILSPATRGGAPAPAPSPATQANANADDGNEAEAVDTPPPPTPSEAPAGSNQQQPAGVRTPQQLFEQLQQMRAAQQRGQQQPVQQDSPTQ